MFFSGMDGSLWIAVLYGYLFNAVLFYGNAFWLFPSLYKSNRAWFWIGSVGLLICCQVIEVLIDGVFGSFLIRVPNLPSVIALAKVSFWQTFLINLIFWALGLAYHMPLELVRKRREHQLLSQEKLEAELAFLRAQINPHSLFNGINSIYHLIDQKPGLAKDTLLQLSELLRYQLYECRADYIDLNKELLNLQNYISLEEIRKGEDAEISTTLPFTKDRYELAPLLLIPFVENAFKHLSHFPQKRDNQLNLRIEIANERLKMELSNTFQKKQLPENNISNSGIGLLNVRRRLELIYGSTFALDIQESDGIFQVSLHIPLKRTQ